MRIYPASVFLFLLLLTTNVFAEDGSAAKPISLPIRTPRDMDQADRQVIAARSDAIARAAAFYGYTLDSSWSYEQAVCPLAPGHILLNYSRTVSATERSRGLTGSLTPEPGGLSSFSAVVPRQGGVVRIVPLVRAGTAPFVAPWGEHSYSVFNAITAGKEGLDRHNLDLSSGDAFTWGLCYVALVGEQGMVNKPDRTLHVFSATEPTLRIGTEGQVGLSFTVQDNSLDYSIWQLDFSRKGALIQADREQHALHEIGLDATRMAASDPQQQADRNANRTAAAEGANSREQQQPAQVPDQSNAAAPSAGAAPAQQNATAQTGKLDGVSNPSERPPATQVAVPAPSPAPHRTSGRRAQKSDSHPVPDGPPPVWRPVPNE